ncbi:MAG: hypothetical protein M3R36_05325 [Bacteroidota bacterium]|nr:hypothetical protein [Bacteroidota bacterium]
MKDKQSYNFYTLIFVVYFLLNSTSLIAQYYQYFIHTGQYDSENEKLEISLDFKTGENFNFKISKYTVDLNKELYEGRINFEPFNTFKLNIKVMRLMNPHEETTIGKYEQYKFLSYDINPNWDYFIGDLSIEYEGFYELEFYDNSSELLDKSITISIEN